MKNLYFKILILLVFMVFMVIGKSSFAAGIDPPAASPGQCTYQTSTLTVTLSTATSGAEIYYTLDESIPTNLSSKYVSPIVLNGPTILKAVSYSNGVYSDVSSYVYNKVVSPSASISGGEYNLPRTITLSTPSIGGEIFYTTDGSSPSATNGSLYQSPILVDKSMTLKAVTINNEVGAYNLSSPHDYTSNYNNTWTINAPSNAQRVRVHFLRVSTESGHDFVTTSSGNSWSGDVYKVWSNWASGNSMTVSLSSDSLTNGYGFDIDMIEYDLGTSSTSAESSFVYRIYNITSPTANIASGAYASSFNVTLSAQGGDIYYTLDGSDPTVLANSIKYTSPVLISSNSTLRAVTYNSTYDRFSDTVSEYDYTIATSALTPPSASPDQGVYSVMPTVTLTSSNQNSLIYYTTDGSTPTSSSSLYFSPIPLTGTTVVKAISYYNGTTSPVASFYYYAKPSVPTVSPAPNWYTQAQTVTLSTPTTNASIKYTLDGSVPDAANSTAYTGSLSITSSTNVRAVSKIQTFYGVNFESLHPYPNNSNTPWVITGPSGTARLRVHFAQITTKTSDFVKTSAGNSWSGSYTDLWSDWQTGNSITVTLTSDSSLNDYGFNVDKIEYESNAGLSDIASFNYGILVRPSSNLASGTVLQGATAVTLSNSNSGDIYYTLDGSTPSASNGTKYTAPISITGDTTIKAVSYVQSANIYSSVVSFTYYLLSKPTASLADGAVITSSTYVSLSNNNTGVIYYTLDGTTPSATNGTKYTGYFSINASTTLKAVTYVSAGSLYSDVSTYTYYFLQSPTISPAPGVYDYGALPTITLSSNIPSATIYYAYSLSDLNGYYVPSGCGDSTYVNNSITYTSPFALSSPQTIYTRAYYNGVYSPAASFTYNSPVMPYVNYNSSYYYDGQTVILNTPSYVSISYNNNVGGVTIKYTTDGTTPDANNGITGTSVNITSSSTLKAVSIVGGKVSPVMSVTFNVINLYAPTANPPGGTFNDSVNVTVANPGDSSNEIYYTINGGTPTKYSSSYTTGPITLNASTTTFSTTITLKVIAYNRALNRYSTYNTYTFTLISLSNMVVTPTASPSPGQYSTYKYVYLSTSTSGAKIYYTLDGSTPTTSSRLYSGYIYLTNSTTIKAVAAYTDSSTNTTYTSNVGTFNYIILYTPYSNQYSGTYRSSVSITLSTSYATQDIYYTIDGSDPATSSTKQKYTSAIPLTSSSGIQTITLKARSYDPVNNVFSSGLLSNIYKVYYFVDAVTLNPINKGSSDPFDVTLSTTSQGAVIYYTLDSSDPSNPSNANRLSINNGGSIRITASIILKAIAFLNNTYSLDSSLNPVIVTSDYKIIPPPTASPAGGVYGSGVQITLSGVTGGTIRYTTDGSTPTSTSTLYTGPISADNSFTLKAINVLPGIGISTRPYVVESPHDYPDNYYNTWTVRIPGSPKIRVHFSSIQTEPNYDYVSTSAGDSWNGSYSDVWSSWVTGDTITVNLSSDSSVTYYGFYIDKIDCGEGFISSVATNQYTIIKMDPPQANYPSGNYKDAIPVTLTAAAGNDIYYTTDGSDPVSSSTASKYVGPVILNKDTVLKAAAYSSQYNLYSVVSTFNYTILAPPIPTPGAGVYTATPLSVTLESPDPAVKIYYTLDVTNPVTSGILYTGPIQITKSTYINAVSRKNNNYSNIGTYLYNILIQPTSSLGSGDYTGSQIVALSTSTFGASIYYTLDGSTPSASHGTLFAQPFTIDIGTSTYATKTLKAVTVLGTTASPVSTYTYNIYRATVLADPPSDYFNTSINVTLSSESEGQIYYTLDGTDPTTSSTLYTAPIYVEGTAKIKAFLYNTDTNTSSRISEFNYTFIAPPTASPAQGKYTILPDVTLSTDTPGAKIYYTFDESIPNNMSTLYKDPIVLTQPKVIKAVSYIYGKYSQPATFIYNKPVPPVSDLPTGEYIDFASIGLSTTTISGKIYYTTDGTNPSALNGTLYTGTIKLDKTTTIKAVTVENPIEGYVLDSPHPYPNNFNKTWTISAPAGTSKMRIHFSRVELEAGYDTLTTTSNDIFSGSDSNVWSNWVDGDSISITLKTDASKTYFGFSVDMIEYISPDMSNLKYSAVRTFNYSIINVIPDANIYQRVSTPSDLNHIVDTQDPNDARLGNYNVFINDDLLFYVIKFNTNLTAENLRCNITFNKNNVSGVKLNLIGATLLQGSSSTPLNFTDSGSSGYTTNYQLDTVGSLDPNKEFAIVLKAKLNTSEARQVDYISNSYEFYYMYKNAEMQLVASPSRTFTVNTRIFKGTIKVE